MHRATPAVTALALLVALGVQSGDCKPFEAKPCFRNEFEAGAIAAQFLANFQRAIQATECDSDAIFQVYKDNFASDLTFTVLGEDLPDPPLGPGPISSIDDVNAAFIQTGIVSGICSTTYISWAMVDVTICEPGQSFLWRGNEVFSPPDENPAAPPPGREYSFVLAKGSCRPTLTAINTRGAFDLGPYGGSGGDGGGPPPVCPE
eukprot:jgi/Ulvmu1/9608/UM054_0038.1